MSSLKNVKVKLENTEMLSFWLLYELRFKQIPVHKKRPEYQKPKAKVRGTNFIIKANMKCFCSQGWINTVVLVHKEAF